MARRSPEVSPAPDFTLPNFLSTEKIQVYVEPVDRFMRGIFKRKWTLSPLTMAWQESTSGQTPAVILELMYLADGFRPKTFHRGIFNKTEHIDLNDVSSKKLLKASQVVIDHPQEKKEGYNRSLVLIPGEMLPHLTGRQVQNGERPEGSGLEVVLNVGIGPVLAKKDDVVIGELLDSIKVSAHFILASQYLTNLINAASHRSVDDVFFIERQILTAEADITNIQDHLAGRFGDVQKLQTKRDELLTRRNQLIASYINKASIYVPTQPSSANLLLKADVPVSTEVVNPSSSLESTSPTTPT